VRLEIQAPATDAALLRALGAALRGDQARAQQVRGALHDLLQPHEGATLLDLLACDLDDALVDEALARPRDAGRAADLWATQPVRATVVTRAAIEAEPRSSPHQGGPIAAHGRAR